MRKPFIAGNWKMNTNGESANALAAGLAKEIGDIDTVDVAVCPPYVYLQSVAAQLSSSNIALGSQNVYFEEKGAYTGEISTLMLADLCEFVIIGHSDRRQYFNDTGEIVNKKIVAALKVDLKPILCVGERLEENEAGKTEEVVTKQLGSSLAGIGYINGLIIAYEPVWAIGTGRAATSEQANETISLIRRNIARLYSDGIAQDMRILYGGSVTAANTTEFMKQPEIDGALVGGASLKATEFLSIVTQTSAIK